LISCLAWNASIQSYHEAGGGLSEARTSHWWGLARALRLLGDCKNVHIIKKSGAPWCRAKRSNGGFFVGWFWCLVAMVVFFLFVSFSFFSFLSFFLGTVVLQPLAEGKIFNSKFTGKSYFPKNYFLAIFFF
jgi:hypothetical protein